MKAPRISFAYVVQCDIPGHPIKVGNSRAPQIRFKSFLGHTPADHRLLGITIDGAQREAALKAALAPTVIRGEWGLPNEDVAVLIQSWVDAGDWYVPVADHAAHLVTAKVRDRMAALGFGDYSCSTGSCSYHWASGVLHAARERDPTLGLDWNGFVPSSEMPDLRSVLPSRERAEAA